MREDYIPSKFWKDFFRMESLFEKKITYKENRQFGRHMIENKHFHNKGWGKNNRGGEVKYITEVEKRKSNKRSWKVKERRRN